jgi:hypothetical protein
MLDFSDLVAAHVVEHPAAYLKCGLCQRVVTKATAVIRRFTGIDVVSCHDCQFEQMAALLVAGTEVNEDDATAVA